MKQLGDFRDLWTCNTTRQQSQREDNNNHNSSPRSPPAVILVSSDDLSQNAHPREGRSDHGGAGGGRSALDDEKAGASLLFSGIFLGLMGMTFTAMGWLNYDAGEAFEWTQLLGPILLSVGATFMLISVCRFGMLPCIILPCRQRHRAHEEDTTMPEILENMPSTGRHPFVFNGAAGQTVMYNIPPPYAALRLQRARSPAAAAAQLSCSPSSPPPRYHAACALDNPAFTTTEGDGSVHVLVETTHHTASRPQETAEYQERDDNTTSTTTRPLPPAYDDLFPSAGRPPEHDLNAT